LEKITFIDVSSIGTEAFMGCIKLCEIDFPENMKSIFSRAFYKCVSLKSLRLSAETIYNEAFYWCTSLEFVEFTDNVKLIKSKAFSRCTNLDELYISDSIVSLGAYSFAGNTSLKKVYLGRGISEILYGAFESTNASFESDNAYCKEWIENNIDR
jgi:hypothetical protein